MNARLKRLLEEIRKTEKRIAEWQEHLKELNVRRKQMEDAEIIKSVRSMKLDSRQLLEVLDRIQNGAVSFMDVDAKGIGTDKEMSAVIGNEAALVAKAMGEGNSQEGEADNKEDDNSESEN